MIYVVASALGLACAAGIIRLSWVLLAPPPPELVEYAPLPSFVRVLAWKPLYRPGWPPFDQDAPSPEDYWRDHMGRES